ncbi:methionine--tRNA ligase, mitochondrial-like [Branchiostoma lanceolatum]|uniref:methionine--tRNA ligase, mitochondrial-like n=1 Tax=Branchiostoma lanceolatum TaxID=7740 RepID=UPI003452DD80
MGIIQRGMRTIFLARRTRFLCEARWLVCPSPYRRVHGGGESQQKERFLITTPIFYVNSVPHLGHLYSAVLADTVHRWQQLKGAGGSIFSTGTDEHGLKIQQAAVSHGKDSLQFCDEVSQHFRDLFSKSHVGHTDFIRTTESGHRKAVEHFWRKLQSAGYIYQGKYEGWYSTSDEAFVPDNKVMDSVDKTTGKNIKVAMETGSQVEWMEEENYMFRLSEFGPRLLKWLDSNPRAVYPSKYRSLVRGWLEEGLEDLSVSRQRDRLPWGIPVPDDSTQTIYVWLDALVNYLTVCGYPDNHHAHWPADCHVVGKDIVRFHAVYWPAFLMAAGLDPPRSVVTHSHWLMESQKMSKSKGNVVDPFDRIQRYSADGLRYFLLKHGVLEADGDYSDEKVVKVLNADLAGNIGGLLNRCLATSLNPTQTFPAFSADMFPMHLGKKSNSLATEEDYKLLKTLQELPGSVDQHYENFHIYKVLEETMLCVKQANGFVHRHKPWKLGDSPQDREWAGTVLHVAMETLRVSGILLQPVMPDLMSRLLSRLGVEETERSWSDAEKVPCAEGIEAPYVGRTLGADKGVLFQRLQKKN